MDVRAWPFLRVVVVTTWLVLCAGCGAMVSGKSDRSGSWNGCVRDVSTIAVTAWTRLDLTEDAERADMSYGADRAVCTKTSVWEVLGQKRTEQQAAISKVDGTALVPLTT